MSAFTQTIFETPMLLEARRFFRKFFGLSRFQKFHYGTVIFLCVAYLFLILIAIAYRESITSDYVIHFQTFLLCFVVPALTYGAVASEREKRTWDFLMIAPIRKSQIILGKFICAVLVVFGVAIQFLPLALICAFGNHDPAGSLVTNEITSIGFGCGLSALGIFLSSLVNRGFTAQVAIYAVLFLWLIMLPMVISALSQTTMNQSFDLWINPFTSIVANSPSNYAAGVRDTFWNNGAATTIFPSSHPGYSAYMQFLFYLIMCFVFVWLAIHCISDRSERRVKAHA